MESVAIIDWKQKCPNDWDKKDVDKRDRMDNREGLRVLWEQTASEFPGGESSKPNVLTAPAQDGFGACITVDIVYRTAQRNAVHFMVLLKVALGCE